jgi:hypothetical protein
MDNSNAVSTPDSDLFIDNQPMNDKELSRLHESTLQMFRSNKIGPKNAFDIVLIDYLPAIFEASSFDDDHINNFQSVGTTLETSGLIKLIEPMWKNSLFLLARIYAARIDSLYSETRKAQSILRSTNDSLHRIIDDDANNDDDDNDGDDHEICSSHKNATSREINSERRIFHSKKIRLMMKKKKFMVNDRQKLLRKNRNDDLRPIMVNQFFLSAMHNDTTLLSELYEKMTCSSTHHDTERTRKLEQVDMLSSSLHSNDSMHDSLYIDTRHTTASASMFSILTYLRR